MIEILRFCSTIIIMALAEICCTWYIIATEERKALKAGLFCALLVAFSEILTLNYVQNNWMVVPTVIGAFIGAFVGTKMNK